MLRDRDHGRRRVRRQVHGRRRARLFRLSAGPRARCGALGEGRARHRRGRAETGNRRGRSAACPSGHRNRDRGRRRSLGLRGGPGTRRRRRHAEPRGAVAGDRRTRQRRHRRGHPQADRKSVRARRSRPSRPQRFGRSDARLQGAAREFAGKPLRGVGGRADGAGRARGRNRFAAAALDRGEDGRGAGRASFRRGGHRQVAPHGGVGGAGREGTACAHALLLFPTTYGQRAASDHRPHGESGRSRARRRSKDQARQARRAARDIQRLSRGRRPSGRDALPAERRPLSRVGTRPAAAPAENHGRADRSDRDDLAPVSAVDDLRGRALGRSFEPGSVGPTP